MYFAFEQDMATEIVANGVSSVSSKTAYHLLQLWKNAEFAQYDYFLLNPKVYGRTRPPKYDLSKTSAPVVLFGGNEDNLISPPVSSSLLQFQLVIGKF
jgi:hypothetical protein